MGKSIHDVEQFTTCVHCDEKTIYPRLHKLQLGHTSRPAQEHEAAEMIQALWRGKVDRIAISERRAASKELQRLTRGRASRVEARSVRERTNAATVVAAQVRGFIDRQWVQMLRAEEVRRALKHPCHSRRA